MKLKVKTNNNLNIRQTASVTSANLGLVKAGTTTIVVEKGGSGGYEYYKLEDGRGWICMKEPGVNASYITVLENLEGDPPKPTPPASQDVTNAANNGVSDSNTVTAQDIDQKIKDMISGANKTDTDPLDASTKLFGCPFQLLNTADLRVSKNLDLGRKYIENFIAEAPIVFFQPGKPNYLPDIDEDRKKSLTQAFSGVSDGDGKSMIDEIISDGDVRYFDFIPDYADYIRYVNLLCRACAIYLGIGDKEAPDGKTKYKYYNWENYKYRKAYAKESEASSSSSVFDKVAGAVSEATGTLVDDLFGAGNFVQFYVEPNTSSSESASNGTQHSMLESMVESGESIMKEMSFLLNTGAVSNADEMIKKFGTGMQSLGEHVASGGQNIISRLLGVAGTTVSGANFIFPEIWSDSDYNKSYSVSINLVSPYGDKESIYLNVIVPMMHLLALSLPRQTTANSYGSPFLVKVFSKGRFSCEMGIVDSISLEKGGSGDAWSVDGLPLEVKMSVSIKDLYTNLMVSSTKQSALFFQNQGLIDFLSVTCGVDITRPNLELKVESMLAMLTNKPFDIGNIMYNNVIESLKNTIMSWTSL